MPGFLELLLITGAIFITLWLLGWAVLGLQVSFGFVAFLMAKIFSRDNQ